jgi:hypothetical protein
MESRENLVSANPSLCRTSREIVSCVFKGRRESECALEGFARSGSIAHGVEHDADVVVGEGVFGIQFEPPHE